MLIKKELLIVLGLAVIVILLAAALTYFSVNVESADAGKFVLEDLRTKYPKADIEVLEVKEKFNADNKKYFEVNARVTEDYESACPKRSHIYYNYPVQNFVPSPAEKITTSSCTVCTSGSCIINYPEEAIIASHTLAGTSEVHSFIQTQVAASVSSSTVGSYWLVRWSAPNITYLYEVKIAMNGTVVSVSKGKYS